MSEQTENLMNRLKTALEKSMEYDNGDGGDDSDILRRQARVLDLAFRRILSRAEHQYIEYMGMFYGAAFRAQNQSRQSFLGANKLKELKKDLKTNRKSDERTCKET